MAIVSTTLNLRQDEIGDYLCLYTTITWIFGWTCAGPRRVHASALIVPFIKATELLSVAKRNFTSGLVEVQHMLWECLKGGDSSSQQPLGSNVAGGQHRRSTLACSAGFLLERITRQSFRERLEDARLQHLWVACHGLGLAI